MMKSTFAAIFATILLSYAFPVFAADDIEVSAPKVQATVTDDAITLTWGQNDYRLENPADGTEDRNVFETLSSSDRAGFHHNRSIFLVQAAKALSVMKYGFGIGAMVKDRISYRIKIRKASGDAREQLLAQKEELFKLSMRERSNVAIHEMLKSLDRTMWHQSALFAHSNEAGVMMAGGLQMMAAVPGKFAFGGLVDFGISIGYNRDTQAVAIQVFGDFEKLTVNSAVILLGPVGKSGLYIANQRPGGLDHKGTSFYPPMVPGFSTMTEDTFTTGVSTGGIFTIPPSPFGDAFTYTDKYDQRVLLRLTISPLVTGFVRVELARMLIAPVSQAVTLFKRASKKIQECTSLLADSNLDDELP